MSTAGRIRVLKIDSIWYLCSVIPSKELTEIFPIG